MKEAHAFCVPVRVNAGEWTFRLGLEEVTEFAEMRVPVRVVNEGMFVAMCVLDGGEPFVELFWMTDCRRQTTVDRAWF